MKKLLYLFIGFLIIGGLFSSSNNNEHISSPQQTNPSTISTVDNTSAEKTNKSNLISAKIISIIDGDTIEVDLNGKSEKVRFIGVDTPETKHPNKPIQPYGKEASDFTTQELTGKTVYLEMDTTQRDNYGRLLAYIWLEQPMSNDDKEIRNKMFNAKLLLNGYAQILTIPPNIKYVDNFTKYQTESRNSKLGLWKIPVTTTTPVKSTTKTTETKTTENKITTVFFGSSKSDKYHYPSCSSAKRIKDSNLVKFNGSKDARNLGYIPCSKCSPP